MSTAAYVGVGGEAKKIKALFVGVGGVAQKVKKGYVVVDGAARLFYAAEPLLFTGTFETEETTIGGKPCTLYKIIKSGTLTVNRDGVRAWICGGGGSSGGGGGYAALGDLPNGTYTVTIGAARSTTSIKKGEETVLEAKGSTSRDGGSGAGGDHEFTDDSYQTSGPVGKGQGSIVIPFGEIQDGYCAGGQGYSYSSNFSGGNGGSKGSNGEYAGAYKSGGYRGGGSSGASATFYGSGGGGSSANPKMSGGSGYQGIALILVPKD